MMMMMFLHGWPESCPSGVILKHSINKSLRNLQLMQKKKMWMHIYHAINLPSHSTNQPVKFSVLPDTS